MRVIILFAFLAFSTSLSIQGQEFDSSFRECQKYIYLKPNATQLLLSDQEGLDSIFSQEAKKRKFKMRLTSKSTGKKIDINFSFAKKNNSTET